MNLHRFENKFVKSFASGREAMEESNSYYDDRAAIIEKWIDNRWCAHSDPLYHPWHTTAAKMEVG
jgi:hypothetical protein